MRLPAPETRAARPAPPRDADTRNAPPTAPPPAVVPLAQHLPRQLRQGGTDVTGIPDDARIDPNPHRRPPRLRGERRLGDHLGPAAGLEVSRARPSLR